ncbi:hypothetical protein BC833DRAFT_561707 [Globomyces pollinis-pini]|nr:hypothetical protein BC833DRAFT_561707 [Globomyces pollinis-pini]KAJ2994111.1 hypothetical protein HDV02_001848 [Globomyces sp. JEL0801]
MRLLAESKNNLLVILIGILAFTSTMTMLMLVQYPSTTIIESDQNQERHSLQKPFYLGFDHIFIISTGGNSRRYRFMKAQFEAMRANFTLFQAYTDDNQARIQEFMKTFPDFKETESSNVKRSHFGAYHAALQAGYNNVLIMEDDVDFDFAASSLIPAAISQLPLKEWDYLGLFFNLEGSPVEEKLSNATNNLYKMKLKQPLWIGGVAYALTKKAMKHLLKEGISNGLPGDVTVRDYIMTGAFNGFVVNPLMVDHLGHSAEFPSQRQNMGGYPPYKSRLANSIFEALRTE